MSIPPSGTLLSYDLSHREGLRAKQKSRELRLSESTKPQAIEPLAFVPLGFDKFYCTTTGVHNIQMMLMSFGRAGHRDSDRKCPGDSEHWSPQQRYVSCLPALLTTQYVES